MKTFLKIGMLAGLFAFSASVLAATGIVTLSVPGMTCPVCPITIKKTLGKVSGVNAVGVRLDKKEVMVTFDDTLTNVEALQKAITAAGYPSTVRK